MKTSNLELLNQLNTTKNVVTKNSLENILLNRSYRGDIEAGSILYKWLKGWV